jgi:hypothetical protein
VWGAMRVISWERMVPPHDVVNERRLGRHQCEIGVSQHAYATETNPYEHTHRVIVLRGRSMTRIGCAKNVTESSILRRKF